MKILIVGFGVVGIYAANALKVHQLDIISSDIQPFGNNDLRRYGRVDEWGGILYNYSGINYYSKSEDKVNHLGDKNLNKIQRRLNIKTITNKGVLFKARSRWFKRAAYEIEKVASIRNGVLIKISDETLIFDKYTVQITAYDKVLILLDHLSMLKVLQRSAIIGKEAFYGNHLSKEVSVGNSYDTHYIKRGQLTINREVSFFNNKIEGYVHTIPTSYAPSLENLIVSMINRKPLRFFVTALNSICEKWFWFGLISLFVPVRLSAFVDRHSLISKRDLDVKPSHKLLTLRNGEVEISKDLNEYVPIAHEYGIDSNNLKKLLMYQRRHPNIDFNPSIYINNLGPANITLPLFQIIEEQIGQLK